MGILEVVGKNVRNRRLERAMTQEELGHQAKLETANVSKLERGKLNATLETLERVAGAFGISPRDLLNELDATATSPQRLKPGPKPGAAKKT
jgi:transcriptional regulator with XRE-family HTH domain